LYLGEGYLWLAWAAPGPADDVRCCNNHINKDDLPDGYLDQCNDYGQGTLAGGFTFHAKEIEVWHVVSGGVAKSA